MPFPLHLIRLRAALVVGLAVLAGAPAAASAAFTPGARSLGDSLFPTIGNGGYDVRHYDLDLDYAVARSDWRARRPSMPSPHTASPASAST